MQNSLSNIKYSIALKDGPGFGEATNNSVGVVDEDAVSGFGDYNYDYENEEETVDSQTMDDSGLLSNGYFNMANK